jgi:hypothetical protein
LDIFQLMVHDSLHLEPQTSAVPYFIATK